MSHYTVTLYAQKTNNSQASESSFIIILSRFPTILMSAKLFLLSKSHMLVRAKPTFMGSMALSCLRLKKFSIFRCFLNIWPLLPSTEGLLLILEDFQRVQTFSSYGFFLSKFPYFPLSTADLNTKFPPCIASNHRWCIKYVNTDPRIKFMKIYQAERQTKVPPKWHFSIG